LAVQLVYASDGTTQATLAWINAKTNVTYQTTLSIILGYDPGLTTQNTLAWINAKAGQYLTSTISIVLGYATDPTTQNTLAWINSTANLIKTITITLAYATDSVTTQIKNLMAGTATGTIAASISLSAIGQAAVFQNMNLYLRQIWLNTTQANIKAGAGWYGYVDQNQSGYWTGSSYNTPTFAEGGWATGPDSGYDARLHGTELVVSPRNAVPVRMSGMADGYNDPEIKEMLRELIVLTKQKQNVNLTVEDGRSFPAYVMAKADENRVEANERKGTSRRRLRR
jgi:hypothetical protein